MFAAKLRDSRCGLGGTIVSSIDEARFLLWRGGDFKSDRDKKASATVRWNVMPAISDCDHMLTWGAQARSVVCNDDADIQSDTTTLALFAEAMSLP
jgi:hypothetical protein